MILFAESNDGMVAVFVTISGLVSGGIVWLANYYTNLRKERRKEDTDDEETALNRLNTLLLRVDNDRKECIAENAKIRKEIEELREKRVQDIALIERAISWIKYLEYHLERSNIPHPKWVDLAGGSGPHVPLGSNPP